MIFKAMPDVTKLAFSRTARFYYSNLNYFPLPKNSIPIENLLECAGEVGSWALLNWFVQLEDRSEFASSCLTFLLKAAKNGHKDAVVRGLVDGGLSSRLLIPKDEIKEIHLRNERIAIRGGKQVQTESLMVYGAILEAAGESGNCAMILELAKAFPDVVRAHIQSLYVGACRGGHWDIIDTFSDSFPYQLPTCLQAAIEGDELEIVEFLYEMNPRALSSALILRMAVLNGSMRVLEWLEESGLYPASPHVFQMNMNSFIRDGLKDINVLNWYLRVQKRGDWIFLEKKLSTPAIDAIFADPDLVVFQFLIGLPEMEPVLSTWLLRLLSIGSRSDQLFRALTNIITSPALSCFDPSQHPELPEIRKFILEKGMCQNGFLIPWVLQKWRHLVPKRGVTLGVNALARLIRDLEDLDDIIDLIAQQDGTDQKVNGGAPRVIMESFEEIFEEFVTVRSLDEMEEMLVKLEPFPDALASYKASLRDESFDRFLDIKFHVLANSDLIAMWDRAIKLGVAFPRGAGMREHFSYSVFQRAKPLRLRRFAECLIDFLCDLVAQKRGDVDEISHRLDGKFLFLLLPSILCDETEFPGVSPRVVLLFGKLFELGVPAEDGIKSLLVMDKHGLPKLLNFCEHICKLYELPFTRLREQALYVATVFDALGLHEDLQAPLGYDINALVAAIADRFRIRVDLPGMMDHAYDSDDVPGTLDDVSDSDDSGDEFP